MAVLNHMKGLLPYLGALKLCCVVAYFSFAYPFLHVDIRAEMMPDELPDRSEVSSFDHSKLKHVETQEKEVLPTKSG